MMRWRKLTVSRSHLFRLDGCRRLHTALQVLQVLLPRFHGKPIPVRPIRSRAGGRAAHGTTAMGATGMVWSQLAQL
eukprot:3137096-Prymnesium_polylepis.1